MGLLYLLNINFVTVTCQTAVFHRSILRKFPTSVEEATFEAVIYMLQEDDNSKQRSVMLSNNIT